MDYQIILSPRAIQDLEGAVRYIAFDNPQRAESYGRELIEKTKVLRQFPELGRMVPEFRGSGARELIHGNYRIVYRVNHVKRTVEVSRFWHGARGTPELY
ncbi:MAG: type II toxin-antitoxin system RelE/ParE family toxin [Verrucomicrobia bacterium]|nr:type II toxin-antitoxin system RelE/ParE family toxin [Verrucomicrobiota bacterium]